MGDVPASRRADGQPFCIVEPYWYDPRDELVKFRASLAARGHEKGCACDECTEDRYWIKEYRGLAWDLNQKEASGEE
jgi:hypothetical protein